SAPGGGRPCWSTASDLASEDMIHAGYGLERVQWGFEPIRIAEYFCAGGLPVSSTHSNPGRAKSSLNVVLDSSPSFWSACAAITNPRFCSWTTSSNSLRLLYWLLNRR